MTNKLISQLTPEGTSFVICVTCCSGLWHWLTLLQYPNTQTEVVFHSRFLLVHVKAFNLMNAMRWSGFVYISCGFPWHMRECERRGWGCLPLIDGWGCALRICGSGAHSDDLCIASGTVGKDSSLSGLMDICVDRHTDLKHVSPQLSCWVLQFQQKKNQTKKQSTLSISACIISHHPDCLVHEKTTTC